MNVFSNTFINYQLNNFIPPITRNIISYDFINEKKALKTNVAREIEENGYALIDDWNIDMKKLSSYVSNSLKHQEEKAVTIRNVRIPLNLTQSFKDTAFKWAVDYLGNDVIFSGYSIIKLSKKLHSAKDYFSGKWHHDRCGKRLKAFVLLDDVTETGGHMTKIITKTHTA